MASVWAVTHSVIDDAATSRRLVRLQHAIYNKKETMKFSPKTDEEIKTERNKSALLPDGIYDYEVIEAVDTKSQKTGVDMIKLKLKVFVGESSSRTVWEYLMESNAAKLKQFCDSHGLQKAYASGDVRAGHFMDLAGKAKIFTEKGKGGYEDANKVFAYIVPGGPLDKAESKPAATGKPVITDDDIPF